MMDESNARLGLQSNIWKFYLYSVILGSVLFFPIIVLFWQENGLGITEIMILQSLFSLAVVVLEVPSGYFADVYGRRLSLFIAGAFLTVAVVVYGAGYDFYHFLAAEILWAFGVSFVSGADSAFVYDTLKDMGREGSYKRVWGNVMFLFLMANSVSSIIGAYIGKFDFRWTFYVMVPILALLVPLSLSMKEPHRHKVIFEKGYARELFRIMRFALLDNVKLRWLIIYAAVIGGFNSAVLWLYQPYFVISGLDIAYFGFVFAAFNLVAAFSSKYAHAIEKKIGEAYSLAMLVFLVGASYLMMGNFIYLFSFSFAFLQQFTSGFFGIVITDYINKLTASDVRATVLSAQSLFSRLFYAAIIPVVGWVADVYSLIQALSVLGVTTLVAGAVILLILRRERVI